LTKCTFEKKRDRQFPLYVDSITERHDSNQKLKFFKQIKLSLRTNGRPR